MSTLSLPAGTPKRDCSAAKLELACPVLLRITDLLHRGHSWLTLQHTGCQHSQKRLHDRIAKTESTGRLPMSERALHWKRCSASIGASHTLADKTGNEIKMGMRHIHEPEPVVDTGFVEYMQARQHTAFLAVDLHHTFMSAGD
jgi:hypothetical protein